MTDHIQIDKTDSHYEDRKKLMHIFEQAVENPRMQPARSNEHSTDKEDVRQFVDLVMRQAQIEVPEVEQALRIVVEEMAEFVGAVVHGEPAEDVLKEACDVGVVVEGFCAMYNWDYDTARKRVHQSQLTKLVDGKPVKNEHGKFIKGPDYQAPDLTDLV